VKGENMNFLCLWTNKFQKSFAHGNYTRVGKGKAENILWRGVAIQQNISDSGSKNMRFSGTGACNSKHWTIDTVYGFELSFI
jgi:hypothetical protein